VAGKVLISDIPGGGTVGTGATGIRAQPSSAKESDMNQIDTEDLPEVSGGVVGDHIGPYPTELPFPNIDGVPVPRPGLPTPKPYPYLDPLNA
jgi:hypothetical protein